MGMQSVHHLIVESEGTGDQCQTVDINVKGSYSELLDECDDTATTNDFYSRSYVVNECIVDSAAQISTKLLCDDEKISFLYFKNCNDCLCDDGIQKVYEYYADKQCFDVSCNSNIGLTSHTMPNEIQKVNGEFIKKVLFKNNE